MIYIEERVPVKLPGWSSLFVNFDYNSKIVEVIKQLPLRVYNKDSKEWEVPTTDLKYLVESLTKIDVISFSSINSSKKQVAIEIPKDYEFKTKPFKHQLEAIQYGLNNDKWLLLDDMGLGKALTAIYIAELYYHLGLIKKVLVICGLNSLKWNWESEISRHSKLPGKILGKYTTSTGKVKVLSVEERTKDLLKEDGSVFLITNIETLRGEKTLNKKTGKLSIDNRFVKAVKKAGIDMLIVDEVQYAKDPTSLQGEGLLKLATIDKILVTSGTIIENSPLDSYVPLKLIDQVKTGFTIYKTYYCITGEYHKIVGYRHLDYLKEHISRVSLRRKKQDVLDLPPKTYIIEYVEMGKKQEDFYNKIEQGVSEQLDLIGDNPMLEINIKARLRQATAWPGMLSSEPIESAKLERLYELINDIVEQGDKVLVFSTFKAPIHQARAKLSHLNTVLCDGDVDDAIIEQRKAKFQTDEECKVMFATWQKMGTGHTLTAASYVIFIDTPYNDSKFQQSVDRAYRIGTTKNVTVITLVTKNTYDERVLEIVQSKEEISDYIIDGELKEDVSSNLLGAITNKF